MLSIQNIINQQQAELIARLIAENTNLQSRLTLSEKINASLINQVNLLDDTNIKLRRVIYG